MPVTITSQRSRARAVVVSPSFFARAVAALEDQEDINAAEIAREEVEEIQHAELKKRTRTYRNQHFFVHKRRKELDELASL